MTNNYETLANEGLRDIVPGEKGPQAAGAQEMLKFLGYPIKVDGDFRDRSSDTVKAFQEAMKKKHPGLPGMADAKADGRLTTGNDGTESVDWVYLLHQEFTDKYNKEIAKDRPDKILDLGNLHHPDDAPVGKDFVDALNRVAALRQAREHAPSHGVSGTGADTFLPVPPLPPREIPPAERK